MIWLIENFLYLCNQNLSDMIMSYSQIAQLELLNALNNIKSEAELNEFKNLLAHYFAQKAQKSIDSLWDKGVINKQTIEQWGYQSRWGNNGAATQQRADS